MGLFVVVDGVAVSVPVTLEKLFVTSVSRSCPV